MIEILVAIAVIAVLGSIAVTALVPISERSETIVAKKNAQAIVETASTAMAVDRDYLAGAADVDAAVAIALGGFTAAADSGVDGFHMGLLTLDADQQAAAKEFITFEAGRLVFNGETP